MTQHDDDMNFGYDEEEGFLPDTTDVEDGGDFDLMPPGVYVVEVEKTEQTKSKAGDPMLKLQLNVVEGDYEGRKLFDQIMLRHSNPKAEKIGLQRLKMLKVAVGRPEARAEHDLWAVPMLAKVKVQKDKSGEYGDRNAVTAYKPLEPDEAAVVDKQRPAARPVSAKPAPAAAKPAPAATSAKAASAPWNRK